MKEEDRNKRIKNELKNKFQNKNVNILFMPDEFPWSDEFQKFVDICRTQNCDRDDEKNK